MPRFACGAAVALALVTASVAPAGAQVVIDRVLERVGGQVITELDVRRARLLQLVPAEATTDAAIQRELENHWLMVAEVERFSPDRPDPARVAADRVEWQARLGAGVDLSALLARAGIGTAELDSWFEGALKIRDYLDARFDPVPIDDRPAAIAAWVRSLRDRAGLR